MLLVAAAVIMFTAIFGTLLYGDYADTQTLVTAKSLLVPQLSTLKQAYYIQTIHLEKLPTNNLILRVTTTPASVREKDASCASPDECVDVSAIQTQLQAQTGATTVTITINH